MLGEIQALNALAAEHIGEGDHRHAVEILNLALLKLSSSLLAPRPIDSTNGHQAKLVDDVNVYVYFWESVEKLTSFLHQPCMFECKLSFEQDDDFLTNEQFCSCAIASLFNLGLCYHLEWKKRKLLHHINLLSKALHYYEQAFSMTRYCQFHASDSVLQVVMAVCTNASHCNSELANFEQVKLWNERLSQALRFSRQGQESQRQFFHLTVFLNNFCGTSAPAA